METSLIAWSLWKIPECIAITALVYSLGLKELPWMKIIIISLFQAMFAYFIGLLPLTPGVNIFIEIPILALLFVWITGLDVRIGLICCMTGAFLLLVLEGASNLLIQHLGVYSEENLQGNYYLQGVLGYPRLVIILVLAILNKNIKKNVFNTAWKFILK